MKFSTFALYLEKLEKTSSRLEMSYQLADLYSALDEQEVVQASYLMQGSLVPRYLSLEFQLSTTMILKALAKVVMKDNDSQDLFGEQVSGSDFADNLMSLKKKYKKSGDIGNVAQEVVLEYGNSKSSLSILSVYQKLKSIAEDGGNGSQDRKTEQLALLLFFLDGVSAKFVARIVVGKLRLGFSAMTILDALSWSVLKNKDHRELLEIAYQKRADIGELAREYLALARKLSKENNLEFADILAQKLAERYVVKAGIPVVPALCQRLNSSEEIINKMDWVMAEPKYDGLRIQLHYSKKGFGDSDSLVIKAFTRNLEDVTVMFPELEQVAFSLNCESCVLDAEAIGYSPQTGELLPFQETMTRKRKHLIAQQSQKVPIRFYVFDCMLFNGKSLIDVSLQKRKEVLRKLFVDTQIIKYTTAIVTNNPVTLKKFHLKQLKLGLEGAVMKQIDSEYKGGRKGWRWVKIKEEEGSRGKLKDTLDLVVMGYYFGKGKRSKFGVGAFLVGVLDEKQNLKTIAKIGTGLTDDQFIELKSRVDQLKVNEKPVNYQVAKILLPDVWIDPKLVVEIAGDELTTSSNHTAGVALRFPRLVKFRDDKDWLDATTIKELERF